jgi:hypothetical protein
MLISPDMIYMFVSCKKWGRGRKKLATFEFLFLKFVKDLFRRCFRIQGISHTQ